ncbi:MAG: HlyC/CorC family transporter [Wolbachia endosymbiont of Xenopsylla cheopis]
MDWLLVYSSVGILFLLFASCFLSGAEKALTSISQSRIHKLKLDGNKKAKIIEHLLNRKKIVLGTVLLGNTVVNISSSALSTAIFMRFFGNEGILLSTALITVCILLFCEVLPKTYAIQNPERVALLSSYIINFLIRTLSPFAIAVQFIVNCILKLLRLDKNKEVISAADAIRNIIFWHDSKGTMLKEDIDMLNSILDLAETDISQIMIHRKNLFALNVDQNKEQLIKEMLAGSHSRIPLWKDNPDNIVGILHVKDLINSLRKENNNIERIDITKIMLKPWFVPDTTPLSVQLHNFRKNKRHLALVIDEYGSLQGIVTLEDVLEEIVGDISDEHDVVTDNLIKKVSDMIYHIGGEVSVRDINRQLRWNLPEEDASTLAGIIINDIERIPEEGEEFEMHGFIFKILRKEKNIITTIEVCIKNDTTNSNSE